MGDSTYTCHPQALSHVRVCFRSYTQDCGNGAADGQCPNHIWQDINNSGSGKHPLIDKRDIGSCKDAQINSCIGNRDGEGRFGGRNNDRGIHEVIREAESVHCSKNATHQTYQQDISGEE